MVCEAQPNDKSAIRQLWKLGFGDTEEFMDFYFNERYKTEHTLVYKERESLLACAQVVPFDMLFLKEKIQSTYILGVVTHPDYRRKGYTGQIMNYSLKQQYEKGVCITTLIPQFQYLFDIYSKYGFSEMFAIKETKFAKSDGKKSACTFVISMENSDSISDDMLYKFYEFYHKAYKKTDYTLLKSLEDFRFTLKEFLLFEGRIYISFHKKNGVINGCGFLVKSDGFPLCIKEFLFDNETAKQAILSSVFSDENVEEVLAKTPENTTDSGTVKPLGMARVIHAGKVLEQYAKNSKNSLSLEVSDEIIKENNGVYVIGAGSVTKHEPHTHNADVKVNVSQLINILLRSDDHFEGAERNARRLSSYMNLMLN